MRVQLKGFRCCLEKGVGIDKELLYPIGREAG